MFVRNNKWKNEKDYKNIKLFCKKVWILENIDYVKKYGYLICVFHFHPNNKKYEISRKIEYVRRGNIVKTSQK